MTAARKKGPRCQCKKEPGTDYYRCCLCDNWIWQHKDEHRCSMCGHLKGTETTTPPPGEQST